MPLTKNPSVMNQGIIDRIKEHWEEIPLPTPDNVYYGEQSRYPTVPSIAVVMGSVSRLLTQTGMQATITFPVIILVMHSPIQNPMFTDKEVTQQAENVVNLLDADKTIGGLVIHGMVETIEPGQMMRGELMIATRLSWSGFSKLHI